MSDISIRIEGRAGRITLTREKALNALTYDMCMAVDAALKDWAEDPAVGCVVIDAAGDKAFCAGGDIAELYETGRNGDFAYGRRFWRDEYRMNARMARFPKPVVTFMQGFIMGGGVGLGCHAGYRVVGDSSRIAMPECGIGLVPDVGGSLILARQNQIVPGLGAWMGCTGHRMQDGDTLLGFADHYMPEADWPEAIASTCNTGVPAIPTLIGPTSTVMTARDTAEHFTAPRGEIADRLAADPSDTAQAALKALTRACPLSVACHLEMLKRLGREASIEEALALEYRFTWRSMETGDFLEGIRAQIIDKDRSPKWSHASLADVTEDEVEAMLAPLGDNELTFD